MWIGCHPVEWFSDSNFSFLEIMFFRPRYSRHRWLMTALKRLCLRADEGAFTHGRRDVVSLADTHEEKTALWHGDLQGGKSFLFFSICVSATGRPKWSLKSSSTRLALIWTHQAHIHTCDTSVLLSHWHRGSLQRTMPWSLPKWIFFSSS